MAKVNPPPNDEELAVKRQPKYIVDPKDVSEKSEVRIRQWGMSIMRKLERQGRLDDHATLPQGRIIYYKAIEAEDVDVKNFYPFDDLWYRVFKNHAFWTLQLMHKRPAGNYAILADLTYASLT